MKTLVTGGTGFIGRALCRRLGKDAIIASRKKGIDLTRPGDVGKLPRDVGTIYHLAGQAAVWYANKHPMEDFRQNVLATMNLLEHYRDSGAHIVFASTCAVYGQGELSEDSPLELDSFYAKSKHYCEQMLQEYSKRFKIKSTVARISFVYGPGLERNLVYDVLEGIRKGHVELFISGDSEIDFIHVEDAADGLMACGKKEGTYNISSGCGEKAEKIVQMMLEGRDIPVEYGQRKVRIILDNSLARQKLSWKPNISIQEGLAGLQ